MSKEELKEIKEKLKDRIIVSDVCGGTQHQNEEEVKLIEHLENLQSRIDKTIELIHSILQEPEAYSGKDNVGNILSILQGEEVK